MSDQPSSPQLDEPKTPMWLPALGAALFLIVGIWWATRPSPPPPPQTADAADAGAPTATASGTAANTARPPRPTMPALPPGH